MELNFSSLLERKVSTNEQIFLVKQDSVYVCCIYVSMYLCIYVYMYICIYVYVLYLVGFTPFHSAVFSSHGEIVSYILSKDINVDQVLESTVRKGNISFYNQYT